MNQVKGLNSRGKGIKDALLKGVSVAMKLQLGWNVPNDGDA